MNAASAASAEGTGRREKKPRRCVDLEDEARLLYPLISECWSAYDAGSMYGYDLVGIYILSYLSLRQPHRWISRRIETPIADQIQDQHDFRSQCTVTSTQPYESVRIVDVPSLEERLGGKTYLRRKLFSHSSGSCSDDNCEEAVSLEASMQQLRVVDIFNTVQFTGIKHNVDNLFNKTLVGWALGLRLVKLLSFIPSPMQVLRQQAAGERVVTAFRELHDLSRTHVSRLTYMTNGSQSHARDPLAFLLHDFTHMEHFSAADAYAEQVGFFASVLHLGDSCPRRYFETVLPAAAADGVLWHELEYVISDM